MSAHIGEANRRLSYTKIGGVQLLLKGYNLRVIFCQYARKAIQHVFLAVPEVYLTLPRDETFLR